MLSSAKSLIWLCLMYSGRSFMYRYIRNSMSPSTVPWGTPEVTAIFSDVVFSKSTVCVLVARNDVIKFVIWSDIP